MPLGFYVGAFITILGTIFIAELTDKDALLLLSLATKKRALFVFAAGAIAFTISTAMVVLFGSVLVAYVPIFWVKIAGGAIMLAYALLEYVRGLRMEGRLEKREERFVKKFGRREVYAFLEIVGSLIFLDLAGDATELLVIVFVAQYQNPLLVFGAAAIALVTASAVETMLGRQVGRALSSKNVRRLSIVVFLLIGTLIIVSTGITAV